MDKYTLSDLAGKFTHFTAADQEGWSVLFNLDQDEDDFITVKDETNIFLPFGAREELIKLGLEEVQSPCQE